ncbi:GNAT family N-acetyltransferase [Aeromicrobium sp. Leaf350]|uniref:GNAT family N-acetyltransferase n=1 Tax=Aeromicrobium sp. Leaf350 TaxID=2876565 RepID=UPI001E37E91E|nr:GNAT family N-acetyltransferase [Aeromicrobium sp. Leaf350]
MSALRILEVSTLGDRAPAWDALAATLPLPTPFLMSWWIEGVATEEDHFVLVLDGETLVGGWALSRRRVLGVDRFTVQGGGKLCPDHLDVVAHPDRVAEVSAALRTWWRRPGARVLDLDGIREDALVTGAIAPEARVDVVDVAPYEKLAADPEAYLAARSKSFAKSSRKYRRRLDNALVIHRRLADDEVPAAMETFAALHRVRDDRVELARELPRILRAVELGTAAGGVRVYVGEKDGATGAVLVLFAAGGRLCVYQTARVVDDPSYNHIGTVLDVEAIMDAAADGFHEIDFLRGDESYKRSFVADERRLLRARVARGVRGRALLAATLLAGLLRRRAGAVYRSVVARSRADGATTAD